MSPTLSPVIVEVKLGAEGEVSDYDEVKKAQIGDAAKQAAGLANTNGVITEVLVTAASVAITITFTIPDGTTSGSGSNAPVTASGVLAALESTMGTSAQSSSLLSITVVSVSFQEVTSGQSDDDGADDDSGGGGGGMNTGIIAGAAVGGVVLLLGIAAGVWWWTQQSPQHKKPLSVKNGCKVNTV